MIFLLTALAVFALVILLGLWVHFAEPLAILPAVERLTPNLLYRVKTDRELVALSFDDGPHPLFTPQVLDILEQHGAKATFFLIGERALRQPELVARIRAAGHEVGNHYFKNGHILNDTETEFIEGLEKTERAIGGEKPVLFRPPIGWARAWQIQLARGRGYTSVLGCAYPRDTLHPPLWYIHWLVRRNMVPGAIVILHDGISDASQSIRALPGILKLGAERGLRFVSISELRKHGGD